MDANTPLWKAHDISQQLQDKIEVLPNVERAFVHVDHETTHAPVSAFLSIFCFILFIWIAVTRRSIASILRACLPVYDLVA